MDILKKSVKYVKTGFRVSAGAVPSASVVSRAFDNQSGYFTRFTPLTISAGVEFAVFANLQKGSYVCCIPNSRLNGGTRNFKLAHLSEKICQIPEMCG